MMIKPVLPCRVIKTVRFTLKKTKLYDGERSKALVAAAALWISMNNFWLNSAD